MEYTQLEKDILAMMQRTDFKNISKGDVISFASKIGAYTKSEQRENHVSNRLRTGRAGTFRSGCEAVERRHSDAPRPSGR